MCIVFLCLHVTRIDRHVLTRNMDAGFLTTCIQEKTQQLCQVNIFRDIVSTKLFVNKIPKNITEKRKDVTATWWFPDDRKQNERNICFTRRYLELATYFPTTVVSVSRESSFSSLILRQIVVKLSNWITREMIDTHHLVNSFFIRHILEALRCNIINWFLNCFASFIFRVDKNLKILFISVITIEFTDRFLRNPNVNDNKKIVDRSQSQNEVEPSKTRSLFC